MNNIDMNQNSYDLLYNQLNTAYDPQRQSIATQQAQLPTFYDAQRTGLEQARTNAFRNISSAATGRGMTFSGYTPSEQARYTGATYIPAMGNINNAQTTSNNSLIDQLNQVNLQQRTQATGLYSDQVKLAQQQSLAKQSGGSSGSVATPKALTKMDLQRMASEDTGLLFQDYQNKPADYTEQVIIPQLQQLYPELTPQNIYDIVYPYRKSLTGN